MKSKVNTATKAVAKPMTVPEFQAHLNDAASDVLGSMLATAARMKLSEDEAERNVGNMLYKQVLLAFAWQAQKEKERGEFPYPPEGR